MNRRTFMAVAAAGLVHAQEVPDAIKKLRPMLDGVQPITAEERQARIEKARRLMHENKIDAIVLEGGSSMFYFTGTRWSPGRANVRARDSRQGRACMGGTTKRAHGGN